MNIWEKIIEETETIRESKSHSKAFYEAKILAHANLESSIGHYVLDWLKDFIAINESFTKKVLAFFKRKSVIEIIKKDIYAAYKRDPACNLMVNILLFYKGVHALCLYRLAHYLINQGNDSATAFLLQYISSIKFSVDIHPQATIGKGIFIDHSHGIVIGETAKVGNYVTILQDVTLGGTGIEKKKDRHPKIGEGVLIGAGVKILGNIKIGAHSIIGASSVVLQNIPTNSVVVGIPAKIIKKNTTKYPSDKLDHHLIK